MERQAQTELPVLPARKATSHKGDYGRALLIGGSRGMAGAIALSGMATLRSGSGLVKLAVAESSLDTVAAFEPCYMTVALPADERGRIAGAAIDRILELSEEATVVACGPGLGESDQLVKLVLQLFCDVNKPMVLDADALNAIASQRATIRQPPAPRILTPHPGEFSRLVGKEGLSVDEQRLRARALAARWGVTILLKGHRTLITDGQLEAENVTGNPGMATGGTGDVLTGVITGLLCQGLTPFDAARLGAHVHGLAGDIAAKELGQISLIARDLIDRLPHAFNTLWKTHA